MASVQSDSTTQPEQPEQGKQGRWQVEQVLALAPKPTSVAAAQPLAVPGRWVGLPQTPAEFGQKLYATLRDLDALGAPRLFVQAPPAGEEWAAVRDRLARAAAAGELESGD